MPLRSCLSRSLRCPARECRARKGRCQGPHSAQAPQRAGGMPELLAELQDAVGSQLVVTPARAGAGFVTTLRLVDGQSLCDGRLEEAITSPAWRRVPLEQWKSWDVNAVCSVLGCGQARDVYSALGTAAALSSSPSLVDIRTEEMDGVLDVGSALTGSPEEMDDQLEERGDVSGMGPALNSSVEEMAITCSGPGRAADAISNAVYEELDYKAVPEYQEVPTPPGSLSEGRVKKLPYYTGDSVEGSDTEAAPDPPARPEQGTPEGYDDVLDVPQEAPAPSTGDISEGVTRQKSICVLPTGGICSPPCRPGATTDFSDPSPGNTDYDDVGSSAPATLP